MSMMNLYLDHLSWCYFNVDEHDEQFTREAANILFLEYNIDKMTADSNLCIHFVPINLSMVVL